MQIVEELTVADKSKKAGGIGLEEDEDDEEGVVSVSWYDSKIDFNSSLVVPVALMQSVVQD